MSERSRPDRSRRREGDDAGRVLRRVDWRFLLAADRFQRAACDAPVELCAALREICAEVVKPEAAGSSSVAVIGDSRKGTVRRAYAALAPGGACYVELRRPLFGGPTRLTRRLEREGFRATECYWVWPSWRRGAPQFWLPLSPPGPADHFVRSRRLPERLVPRLKARGLAVVWRGARRLALLAPLVTVTWKPGEEERRRSLAAGVIDRWRAWQLGEPPSSVSFVLLTGGGSVLNKVVVLVFAGTASEPCLAIKLGRLPASQAALDREVAALRTVADHGAASLAEVPRVLFDEVVGGVRVVGETPVDGRRLSTMLGGRGHRELISSVTDLLADFVGSSQPLGREAWWPRLVAPVMDEFTRRFDGRVGARELDVVERQLRTLPPLPLVPEHRDCSPWNVLMTPTGRLALLDWESAEPEGLPALDLVYFLTHAVFFLDGTLGSGGELDSYRRMLAPGSPTGKLFAECVARYATRAHLDPAPFVPLRALAWMIHALAQPGPSSQATGGPVGGTAAADLFLALWREDAARAEE